ncbi:hypothetical protein AURDEDRAFT_166875 [Auricularia subglabra TFB-10046 SS5]|nr:hypothetical protein AURDEDRAFT_166875 [Auricularia subglabra TFB-10046 SS5]
MAPKRRRQRASIDGDENVDEQSQYQTKKSARELHRRVREQVADFVKNTVDPGLQNIADEFKIPLADVRELAHLAMPALAKQRRYSLWQTVVSAHGEDAGDLKKGSRAATETYARVKAAIEAEDWDNDELVMYEALRDELEAGRSIPKMPATIQRSTKASIAEVTRCGNQVAEMLQTLHEHAEVEFCVLVCSGKSHIKFAPQVYHTELVTDFFKFKTGLDCDKLAEELQGYALYGTQGA